MAKKITIAELNLDAKAFLKAAEETKKAITLLKLEQQKLKASSKENTQEYIKTEVELKKLNSKFTQQKNAINALQSPYAKLSKKLQISRNNAKDLAAEFGVNSKQARKAAKEVRGLDRQLKKIDNSVGQNQRSVGKYGNALKGLTSSFLGWTAVIFGAVRALRNALGLITNFEKKNAELSAILQKTTEETKALRDNAEELGATTAKTATEVVKLQIAFARLGFSQQEILNLTKATIDGSIALNAELDDTANLVGAIVRSFTSLSSEDAPKIIDIISLSTAKSALNFEKLSTSIPIVAGAANALNIPLTEVVATLGKLSDSGIDASMSSTALRNIYIESAKRGIDYKDALDEINKSTNKLTTANEIFGKRAAVSALIIANNKDNIRDFDKQLQNAKGTAEEMANKQLKTLSGKVTLLTSAWQGFVFSIENGEGSISKAIKGIITSVTDLLGELKNINQVTSILTKDDLSGGIFGFLGIGVIGTIKRTAEASAQIKLLNEDFKSLKTEGVDDLKSAYVFYEEKLLKAKKTDENYAKLLELQLLRIEDLVKSKKEQIKIDEEANIKLEEQKNLIIDVILEVNKNIDVRALEKKSIEELNKILNDTNEKQIKSILNEKNLREELSRLKNLALEQTVEERIVTEKLIDAQEKKIEQFLNSVKISRVTMLEAIDAAAQARIESAKKTTDNEIELEDKILAITLKAIQDKIHKFTGMKGKMQELNKEDLALLQQLADKETELQSIIDDKKLEQKANFEQRKRDLLNEIELENAATQEEKDIIKAEQDLIKEELELENLKLTIEQKQELEQLLETQHQVVLDNIRTSALEKYTADLKKSNDAILKEESKNAKAREQVAQVLTGALIGMLGDSLGAKLASVAIEGAIQAGLVSIQGAAAQGKITAGTQAAVAESFAATPLTFGQPFSGAALVSGAAGLAASKLATKQAISKILGASALKALGVLATGSKIKGGLYTGGLITDGAIIPESLRNQGGDDVLIQAKRGEVVLNEHQQQRAGGSAFLSSIGVPGFANGGLVGNTVTNTVTNNTQLDISSITDAFAQKVNDIKVVAIVDDIEIGLATKTEIISGANI